MKFLHLHIEKETFLGRGSRVIAITGGADTSADDTSSTNDGRKSTIITLDVPVLKSLSNQFLLFTSPVTMVVVSGEKGKSELQLAK